MKKLLILVFITVLFSGKVFSQAEKDSTKEFIELWVSYSLVKEGITANMYIDIGTGKNHSLYGGVKNGDADNIVFTDEYSTKVLNNEVDVLNYMADTGWKIYNISVIGLLGKDYVKYIFYRMK